MTVEGAVGLVRMAWRPEAEGFEGKKGELWDYCSPCIHLGKRGTST